MCNCHCVCPFPFPALLVLTPYTTSLFRTEEARLIAEQVLAAQREKERLEREEREQLEAKQLETRAEELEEHRLLVEEKLEAAEKWKADQRHRAKWDRYMLCDGSPDPTVPQEINTFMSLWEDERDEDFQSILKKSRLVLSLIEELESLLRDTPVGELEETDAARYKGTVLQLQQLLPMKFNQATEHLLKNASVLSDIETGNMQKVIKDNNLTLCIWANLNKNPRFKGYEFAEESIGFELPKPLAPSGIAVRILHTLYDHLSGLSRTSLPKVKESEDIGVPDAVAQEWEGQEANPEGEEEKTGAESVLGADEEVMLEDRKSTLSPTSAREDPTSATDALETAEEPDKTGGSQLGFSPEGHSPSPTLLDEPEDALEDDIVDLRQFTNVGGVYYFDVLALPPQCKQVNGWTMVQLLEGGLQTYPYPPESYPSTTLGVSLPEKDLDNLSAPPVGVFFKVPGHVIFFEEPQVARWDPKIKNWSTDAITQKKYDPERRELSFKMDAFHTFALFQDAHLNMPYEYWELNPTSTNQVALLIVSAFSELQIEIKEDQCRLASVSGADGDLSRLLGKWMPPLALKRAMQSAGLNVFPAEDSKKYVSVNKKNERAERAAYKEMALLSPSFAFGWSKWNHDCGFENVIVKVKEQKPNPQNPEPWALYMLSSQRAQRLKISESSAEFSDDLYEKSEFHSTLYHMIKEYSGAEATGRLRDSRPLFVDCVYQLLSMTRILAFS
ncbi:hypothetical protein XENTR_v10007543 [Xenopus tropicalis]|nr:hypothetical protein XENTR_v10007543 [Xenopus tropicalis]KAE8613046.1 hypothetical protein XENTR_v10007543 [Xenopus tropicalis]